MSQTMANNEWISGGDCKECLHNEPNHRIADNYGLCSTHSLVNNDLIMENIFKWLEISELIKCSDVCLKWRSISQLIGYKRQYFSHKLLYFTLLSTQSSLAFRDKYRNVCKESMDEVIDSYNHYLSSNRLNEFKFIIVFSKLDFNQMQEFLANQRIPNDCTVVHINCRNEVIGTQEVVPRSGRSVAANHHIEYESGFDLLSGISALFMSRAMPGIEVLMYRDSTILDLKFDDQLKCILVFHIQRSMYGHFTRLKTDSQYLEYLEQLIHDCNNNNTVAFGGVTVDRLASAQTTHSDRDVNQPIDYICCLAFSGHNIRAFSFVMDFNDTNIESRLKLICDELKLTITYRTECIGFVFGENTKQAIVIMRNTFKNMIKIIGCSGISHGLNSMNANQRENLFFKRGKCVLLVIQLNKAFE